MSADDFVFATLIANHPDPATASRALQLAEAAVLRRAADAISALPQDCECDPGRGDAVERLRRTADGIDEQATPDGATAAPFFRPGRTYTHRNGTDFQCVAVTTHPQTGERLAMGWHIDSWALHYPATVGINQWNHEYDGVQPPTEPKDGGQ